MSTIDIARAVARLQLRCPGIPLDGGGYSGCGGGADCPVCLGRPVDGIEASEVDDLHRTVTRIVDAVYAEANRLAEQLAAARVAEAQQVAALAGRQAEAARAERDELRTAARAFVAAIEDPEGDIPHLCTNCDRLALTGASGSRTRCGDHPNGCADLSYAPAWRRLVALAQEGT